MLLFLLALIVAALGIGAYAHYNTGAHDIILRSYTFAGVPDWTPAAVAAGVVLFLFLIQAISASIRIRVLRSRGRSTAGATRISPTTSR